MPAGPEQDSQAQPWHDYSSFRQHVLRECARLGAPWPDDRTLAAEYEHRVVMLARLRARDEIAVFAERHLHEEVKGT